MPADCSDRRIALVAMPWAIFNRPSLQLACLKAYLEKNLSRLKVDTLHPYLAVAHELGADFYHLLSKDMWASEACYAALLFPEKKEEARTLVEKAVRKAGKASPRPTPIAFDQLVDTLGKQLDSWLHAQDWSRYSLIGFSVCFNQLLSSLTAARRLKTIFPHLPIVFGGSSCAGDTGLSLLRNFPAIDYVINGEGEKPLLHLCEFITGGKKELINSGILSQKNAAHPTLPADPGCCRLNNLKQLPIPDFSDYLREQKYRFRDETFIPELPIEFSRGCWWGKCAFCNLNLQWRGYRFKKAEQVKNEVLTLSKKYGSLDFAFTDNVLPPGDSLIFFEQIADLDRNFRFFGEIRAITEYKGRHNLMATYRRGGLTTAQVGIEALSNSLLNRMNKGVTTIDNIAMLRAAQEATIKLEGNLITEFPGSNAAEVEETLKNLEFVMPFNPLAIATFFLGHGSPVDRRPQDFGVTAIVRHPRSSALFPKPLLDKLLLLVKDYKVGRARQKKLWKPVVDKVKAWHDFHRQRGVDALNNPPLSYRDGGAFLIIRQERPCHVKPRALHHRLRGKSREIYLYCTNPREYRELRERFNDTSERQLATFLRDLVQKRLMFAENDKYLSLAVRSRR